MFLLSSRRAALGLLVAFSFSLAIDCEAHTDLISPNGGEQLTAGDLFPIEWTVAAPHNLENWDLWYSVQSADGPWIDIALDLVAGDPTQGSLHLFDWNVPQVDASQAWVRVRMDNQVDDYFDVSDQPFSISNAPTLSCDFGGDGSCGLNDLNAMLGAGPVASGVPAVGTLAPFDLNGDAILDNLDVDRWLAAAATENGLASPYRRGDSNLDGEVNGEDFINWNAQKFTSTLRWDRGDFDGDGANNGADFLAWNASKFQSSDFSAVPAPAPGRTHLCIFAGLVLALRSPRRSRMEAAICG